MDYTQSANHDTAANGQRKHTNAVAPTTRVTAKDMNSVIWELLEVIKAANIAPIQFDEANVISYSQLLQAINALIAAYNPSFSTKVLDLIDGNLDAPDVIVFDQVGAAVPPPSAVVDGGVV